LESLVIANIIERPTRTITSILGVAIGVVLIVVTVGLARGILYDTGRRESSIGAEIMFQPPGAFSASVTTAPLTLPVPYCRRLGQVPGVRAVTPVGRYIRSGAGGLGFEIIEGIADQPSEGFTSYAEISGIRLAEGRPISSDNEILVDRMQSGQNRLRPGSIVTLFNQEFRVAGIYEPEVGSRIKMRLTKMQQLLGAANKCSSILIKCERSGDQDAVAEEINRQLPGNHIVFTRDIPSFYERGMPAFNVFLRVVMGLATIISVLVTLLAMYTAVLERTREIGILKSLGASKGFIVLVIEQEALLLSVSGVVAGFALAFLTKLVITSYTNLLIKFELKWALIAGLIACVGSTAGALYPAVRAANQDAVQALSYE
jgi:putative ABC transport system permease protein